MAGNGLRRFSTQITLMVAVLFAATMLIYSGYWVVSQHQFAEETLVARTQALSRSLAVGVVRSIGVGDQKDSLNLLEQAAA